MIINGSGMNRLLLCCALVCGGLSPVGAYLMPLEAFIRIFEIPPTLPELIVPEEVIGEGADFFFEDAFVAAPIEDFSVEDILRIIRNIEFDFEQGNLSSDEQQSHLDTLLGFILYRHYHPIPQLARAVLLRVLRAPGLEVTAVEGWLISVHEASHRGVHSESVRGFLRDIVFSMHEVGLPIEYGYSHYESAMGGGGASSSSQSEAEQLLNEQLVAISQNALDLMDGIYPEAIEQEDALSRILHLALYEPGSPDMEIVEHAAQVYDFIFRSVPLHEEALSHFIGEMRDVYLDDATDEDDREFIESVLVMMCKEGTGIRYSSIHEQALALLREWKAVPVGLISAS